MHVSKKDHRNCNRSGKKNVFPHENIAYKIKTKTPLLEGRLILHYMSVAFPIAGDRHEMKYAGKPRLSFWPSNKVQQSPKPLLSSLLYYLNKEAYT